MKTDAHGHRELPCPCASPLLWARAGSGAQDGSQPPAGQSGRDPGGSVRGQVDPGAGDRQVTTEHERDLDRQIYCECGSGHVAACDPGMVSRGADGGGGRGGCGAPGSEKVA